MNVVVIIPSAGSGTRFGSDIPKQYIELDSIPILIRTLQKFDECLTVRTIVIPINQQWKNSLQEMITAFNITKEIIFVDGGEQRQDSVFNALKNTIVQQSDIILVHDAVRPFVDSEFINKIINLAIEHKAVIPALTPKETVKIIDEYNFVSNTPDRNQLKSVQTPQGFDTRILIDSYQKAIKDSFATTDDASVVEYSGIPVFVTDGLEENIKITTMLDFNVAKMILSK